MKNKLSKIFWGIWIALGIFLLIVTAISYFNAYAQPDKVIGWVLMIGVGVYIFVIYLGITLLLLILWGIIKLIKYLKK